MADETQPTIPTPTPGRVLLFAWTGGYQTVTELPATVIRALPDGRVDLCVHGAGRYLEASAVKIGANLVANQCRWPPRT